MTLSSSLEALCSSQVVHSLLLDMASEKRKEADRGTTDPPLMARPSDAPSEAAAAAAPAVVEGGVAGCPAAAPPAAAPAAASAAPALVVAAKDASSERERPKSATLMCPASSLRRFLGMHGWEGGGVRRMGGGEWMSVDESSRARGGLARFASL